MAHNGGIGWYLNSFWLVTLLVTGGGLAALLSGAMDPAPAGLTSPVGPTVQTDRPVITREAVPSAPDVESRVPAPRIAAANTPSPRAPSTRAPLASIPSASVGEKSSTAPVARPTSPSPRATRDPRIVAAEPSANGPTGMVLIRGGTFLMGNDRSRFTADMPAHEVTVKSFWIDRFEVTNGEFADFVAETGYRTVAESQGWASVFDRVARQWVAVPGASWQRPLGPGTSIYGQEDCPVVQIAWADADAYAAWSGRRLPTEAEWEFAARGGLSGAEYPWGDSVLVDGAYQANYWQGWFPDRDLGLDGYRGVGPVGKFPPNAYGLYDMSGNVWEWCSDYFDERYYAQSPAANPRGPERGSRKVQRGGSWMCAENYFAGYKVYARVGVDAHAVYEHAGFRTAKDDDSSMAQRESSVKIRRN